MLLRRLLLVLAVLLAVGLVAGPFWIGRIAQSRLTATARARGLTAEWDHAEGAWPARVRFERLRIRRATTGDTLLTADSLAVAMDPGSIFSLHPRVSFVQISRASFHLPSSQAGADTLAPDEDESPSTLEPGAARRSGEALARLLGFQPRELPRLDLRDVDVVTPPDAELFWSGAHIARLELMPVNGDVRLETTGSIRGANAIPFTASLLYSRDDHLRGEAKIGIAASEGPATDLRLRIDGGLTQSSRAVTLHDSTRVWVGEIPLTLGGQIDRAGPRVRFRVAADGLTDRSVKSSLPPALLGPLLDVAVRGSWDHRLDFDLDLAHPDSVRFHADVIPHGLSLDPQRTRLRLLGLDQPFVAQIHLPRDRSTTRDLSSANPYFRPLFGISSALVSAVVTNEDGSFFRHRGFNLEAVRDAITENVQAGAFRRGAGTITMQLVRNLYLGHQRTLARKLHEVVLAWLLEHETGLSKERLLEIYLNIIEWGPGIHGAGEAARFYFDRDPADLSVDESLFLATVVPAPLKWRYRFDAGGNLRPFERAQMHFIGRAMIRKGWLAPEDLPPADSLRVELRGPARMELPPPRS
jgi:hypothetical protein